MFDHFISGYKIVVKRVLTVALTSLVFPSYAVADILVMAHIQESAVALVDAVTYKTLVRFATGPNPHEVRVSPDGRIAYVAAGRYVTAIDLQNRRVKATFDLGEYSAHDIRVSKDGRIFWAACAPSKAVVEVDAESGKIIKTYNTAAEGSWFAEISPDERTIYTPNLEGKSVSIIDRVSGRAQVIPIDSAGYGIDITPDGRFVWVSGGDLTVIDTSTRAIVKRLKASELETGRIRITSDGKKVVVALSKRLAVYDASTYKLINETELTKEPKVLTVSRDGKRAYLTNPADNSMTVVDIQAGKLVATEPTGRRPDGIAWVP